MNFISTLIAQYMLTSIVKLGFTLSFLILFFSLKASSPAINDSLNIHGTNELASEAFVRNWYSTSMYAEFGMPQINHSYSPLIFDDTYSFGGGISFNFRFANWLGVQFGAGLTYQNIKIGISEFNNEYHAVDSEGDSYKKIVGAKNVKEDQTWLFLNIPVAFSYYHSLGDMELYGMGGIEMRHSLIAKYKQSGTYTHQGAYDEYNIVFDDLPHVGFYTDRPMDVKDKMNPDLLIMPFIGIGMLAPGQKSRFFMEARYYFSSNDPFKSEKQASLFTGPDNNVSVFNFQNKSVVNHGDVSFGGFKIIFGVNF